MQSQSILNLNALKMVVFCYWQGGRVQEKGHIKILMRPVEHEHRY